MRLLLIGSGGREHALAWSLSRSPRVSELICAPGNPGMAAIAECVPVPASDLEGIVALARERGVDLAVCGPEAPLVAGLADMLREAGVRVFGPGREGAQLEGSKSWAKQLMDRQGIPTARALVFDDPAAAAAHVRGNGAPVVVKADGLAAGKGVFVCDGPAEAEEAIRSMMERRVFGEAGARVVVEERLAGEELSVLALCDGRTVLAMDPAQDFKRAHDGDTGPNTGGMGSYSPVPSCTPEVLGRVMDEVLRPVADGLAALTEPYVGVLYAGLMLTADGPKVLEFNCRFGDPETQALLPRLESDLAGLMLACVEGSLEGTSIDFRDEACVAVAAASRGYPGEPDTGHPVTGLEEASAATGLPVFHAGTATSEDGRLVNAGGRVLTVPGMGAGTEEARAKAYAGLAAISFEGMWYRSDIAAARWHSGGALP